MGKLGKIFGILVLVLAIVVAVFSFLLSKHRDLFKNRAADLADGIVKTGQNLSSGAGTVVINGGEVKNAYGGAGAYL